jgi:hypothetical protein
MASSHTILLAQFTDKANSRQYSDFETLTQALDGICQLYEQRLKNQQPHQSHITYDITDLFLYIDELPDLAALVYDISINAYKPYNKQWIKDQVLSHLKQQAANAHHS